MPKRNAAANNGSGDTKKARIITPNIKRQWQANMGRGAWVIYCDDHHNKIEKAYLEGKDKVSLLNNKGESLTIDYVSEKNEKTHFSRVVRCGISSKNASEFTLWSYKQGRSFKPFSCSISMKLNTAADDSETKITIEDDDYKQNRLLHFDLVNSTFVDSLTDKTCEFQSTVSDVVKVADSPSPSSSSTASTSSVTGGDVKPSGQALKKAALDKKVKKDATDVNDVKVKQEPEEAADVVTVKIVGKAPVDSYCPDKDSLMVYYEQNTIYDVMLNQTNMNNNNNKYFVIQLLKKQNGTDYFTYFRWGRVGLKGQNNLISCGNNLNKAKELFEKKFHDKTVNYWEDQAEFQKVEGKYDRVKIDYGAEKKVNEVDGPAKKIKKIKSKLCVEIQDLMKLICDCKAMEEVVKEMKFDATRSPLGKLTKTQIKDGYSALKKIDKLVRSSVFDNRLVKACDAFYTRIPHCFGMKRPTKINTLEQIKEKLDLLNALSDIEEAMKIIEHSMSKENPIDSQYLSLKCQIQPIPDADARFELVNKYLQNTHASTHSMYTLELEQLFCLHRHGENDSFKDVGNKKLLWHGSRMTNFAGILSQGLRIAPPEAPLTGYMFGKGVYFADMSSKSANYCYATRRKHTGLLLLCEVALGEENELYAANYNANRLPSGKHSVKALGTTVPDPSLEQIIEGDLKIPCGKGIPRECDVTKDYSLNYNEYIVYDTTQIKMKYLLKINFKF